VKTLKTLETIKALTIITIILAGVLLLVGLLTSPADESSKTMTLYRLHIKNTYYLFSATLFVISCILGVGLAIISRLNDLLANQFRSQSNVRYFPQPYSGRLRGRMRIIRRKMEQTPIVFTMQESLRHLRKAVHEILRH
jgi:hypothetical protein